MTKRILLGGVLAGLTLWIWSFLTHVVLPVGQMGIKTFRNEDAIIGTLKSNVAEPGLYFFPGEGAMAAESLSQQQRDAAMAAFQAKYEAGPRGIMVYHPTGAQLFEPRQLISELLSDIVAGIIVAFALSLALGRLASWGARVGFVTLLGFLPWVVVDFSYFNWYGFPGAYEVGQLIDQVVGMFLAGIVLAFIFRRS